MGRVSYMLLKRRALRGSSPLINMSKSTFKSESSYKAMDNTEYQLIIHSAVASYGIIHRMLIMQEEAAEVIQALSHYMRDRCDKERVCEELADMEFMLDQLKIYFGADKVHYHKIQNAHKMIARLEKRRHGKNTIIKENHLGSDK